MKQVLSLSMMVSEGTKVARLAGNRNFDEKIIKSKMKSLKECGMLVPAIIVDAKDAIDAELDIVDFETGEAISVVSAEHYIVLVDANHRYKAHLDLVEANKTLKGDEQYNREFYLMYALNSDVTIGKMLSEINIATNPWKAKDYGTGAEMMHKGEDLPLLNAINRLTTNGYSVEAASKWYTFTAKVNKTVLAKAMDGFIADILRKTSGLERGERLLEAAKKTFREDSLKTRNLPDWIISKYDYAEDNGKATIIDNIVELFEGLSRPDVERIENAKGKRGGKSRETIINEELNQLFNAKFCK